MLVLVQSLEGGAEIGERVPKADSIRFEAHLFVWMVSAHVTSTNAGKEKPATSASHGEYWGPEPTFAGIQRHH